MTLEANLTGGAAFQFDGSTGVTARIIRELTASGSDPRAWFEPETLGSSVMSAFAIILC
jgi:hypothetical protein